MMHARDVNGVTLWPAKKTGRRFFGATAGLLRGGGVLIQENWISFRPRGIKWLLVKGLTSSGSALFLRPAGGEPHTRTR